MLEGGFLLVQLQGDIDGHRGRGTVGNHSEFLDADISPGFGDDDEFKVDVSL
jgi:hypothetical protein